MKIVAIGGFFHESNTFNPIITSREDFIIFEGEALYTKGDKYPSAQGIADYFWEREGYRILPLVFARAVPNGEVSLALYLELKARFFELLGDMIPDIFVLPLHGSMRVEKIGSAESDLLLAIKRRYPDVPIICALDMHATITDTMLENTKALVGYKTAPHTDAWETGQHAARLADMLLSEGKKLCMKAVKLPYLIAGEKSETECSPMRELIAALRHLETEEGVLAASLLLGFPWADTPDNGVTAVVITDNAPDKAELYAQDLAQLFTSKKGDFGFSAEADEPLISLRKALAESVKPVFVSDSGDNPTAGSTGDNNSMIALLSHELKEECRTLKILVAGIYDPRAVERCKGQIGSVIELKIGGTYDTKYS
ncbi:MAG: M81 family metallopeptidase, partial [Candidatus Cloacimonadaceae bacterium]